jgi:acyl-CoA reductase-like NAD-dependent aldehyde dehydrogenase
MDGRPIKRQVLAGTYPDLQHQTACGPDRPLAIGVQAMGPHHQIDQPRQPAVLTDVTTDIVITKEETFGPVAPLYRFKTDV